MAPIPDLALFVRFNDFDPRTQKQCIYVTQKGLRCRWPCSDRDNNKAIELYHAIIKTGSEDVDLITIKKYILGNCCRSGRAQHRDRIRDVLLLEPLAQRWYNEIGGQSQNGSKSLQTMLNVSRSNPQTLQSEFRPHKKRPDSNETVAYEIQKNLGGRDDETGSLYMFDRPSSPGYVKIGWTTKPVKNRLQDWSKCGYSPNLLFSVHDVPFAQRAETLVHYELIREWRREKMCQASECRKSHREWFEISTERAKKVVSDWATFFKEARPYDSQKLLKCCWKDVVQRIVKSGDRVTGHELLQLHNTQERTRPRQSTDPDDTIKTESQEIAHSSPKKGDGKNAEEHWTYTDTIPIKLQPSLVRPMTPSQPLPQPISLKKINSTRASKQIKSVSTLKVESTSETAPLIAPTTTQTMETKTPLVLNINKDEPVIKAERTE